LTTRFHPVRRMKPALGMRCNGGGRRAEAYGRRHMGQTVRFQEMLRRLAD